MGFFSVFVFWDITMSTNFLADWAHPTVFENLEAWKKAYALYRPDEEHEENKDRPRGCWLTSSAPNPDVCNIFMLGTPMGHHPLFAKWYWKGALEWAHDLKL
jgi:hypothetical protein